MSNVPKATTATYWTARAVKSHLIEVQLIATDNHERRHKEKRHNHQRVHERISCFGACRRSFVSVRSIDQISAAVARQ